MASPEPLDSPRLEAMKRSSKGLVKVMPVCSGVSSVKPGLPSRGTASSAHRKPASGCHASSAAHGSTPSARNMKTHDNKNLI